MGSVATVTLGYFWLNAGMWNTLPFLNVYLHETGLAWDEIVPIALIALTIVVGVVLFFLARRFKPVDDEQESGESTR
jgi:hypothetical protein